MQANRHLEELSPSFLKLIDSANEITFQPTTDDIAFLSRQLVQVTLPHSDPGNAQAWSRKNGNLTLTVRPGWDAQNERSYGYPYGTIPRLILYWMTREALLKKSPRLELGPSLAGFMRELGLSPDRGGKRSDAARLRNQMQRLFRASISFDVQCEHGDRVLETWVDMPIAPKGELWWSRKSPEQAALWGSWIELGDEFYNALITHPVPLDMRALKTLKSSSLALDLYAWTSYRSYRVTRTGTSAMIPWRAIAKQIGAEYKDHKSFKRRAKQALIKVSLVNPGLRYEQVRGGIRLFPSQSAIPAKHRLLGR
ncbi:MAG: replication protein RepA [Planctomycetota bacterium]